MKKENKTNKTNRTNRTNKSNTENINHVKIQILYDNFVDKYTNEKYELNQIVPVSEERYNEILDLENKLDVQLIKLVEMEGEKSE